MVHFSTVRLPLEPSLAWEFFRQQGARLKSRSISRLRRCHKAHSASVLLDCGDTGRSPFCQIFQGQPSFIGSCSTEPVAGPAAAKFHCRPAKSKAVRFSASTAASPSALARPEPGASCRFCQRLDRSSAAVCICLHRRELDLCVPCSAPINAFGSPCLQHPR